MFNKLNNNKRPGIGAMLGACGLPDEDAEDFDEDMEDPFEEPEK